MLCAGCHEGQREVVGYLTDFIKSWDELGFGAWAVSIRDIELGILGDFIGYCGFIPEQIEGAVTDMENTASRRVIEKLGMKHEKDVDFYNSVDRGEGLLPFYSIERWANKQK
jgi:hypothetical protein